MNSTIVAMQNVDKASTEAERTAYLARRRAEAAEAEQTRKLQEAKASREALPSSQNQVFSTQFTKGIVETKAIVERLFDEQVVELKDINDEMDDKILAESAVLSDLTKQVAASRERLARLESEKVRKCEETRGRFTTEIAAARRLIKSFEAGAAVLAEASE